MKLELAYEKYADMLYRLALSHQKNPEDAEDTVQEVFVKYMHHFSILSDDEHERAWLIRTTVNRCYDLLRYNSKRNHEDIYEMAEEIAAEENEHHIEIFHILGKLPVKYKTVIVLHYLEGFSVEEIARMLRISSSAVKMRLSRGREQMKEVIEREENHVS